MRTVTSHPSLCEGDISRAATASRSSCHECVLSYSRRFKHQGARKGSRVASCVRPHLILHSLKAGVILRAATASRSSCHECVLSCSRRCKQRGARIGSRVPSCVRPHLILHSVKASYRAPPQPRAHRVMSAFLSCSRRFQASRGTHRIESSVIRTYGIISSITL